MRWWLAWLGAASVGCRQASDAPVILAAAAPWSDTIPSIGTQRGIQLAVDEINASGGIGGRTLEIRWCDDSGAGARAAIIAESLSADASVLAVIGHINSGAQLAAGRIYDGHLVAVSSQATSPDLSGISHWLFRVVSSDSANGAGLARFAAILGSKRAAILYENDAYGRGLARAFRRSFVGTVLSSDPIPPDAATYEPYVTFIKRQTPDLVFVAGLQVSGLAVLREAKRQGLNVPFLGGDGWTGLSDDSAIAEGAYVAVPFVATDPRPEVLRFVRAFEARYHTDPEEDGALGYDVAQLFGAALRNGGPNRSAIRNYLARLTIDKPYPGVTGPIAFDSAGDPVGRQFIVTRVHAGKFVPINGSVVTLGR